MHVAAGHLAHAVDRVGDGEHVVGQVSLEAALLVLGRAEIDDPRVDPVGVQRADRRRAG